MQPLTLQQERAYFYSPFSFLRENKKQLAENFLSDINQQAGTQLTKYQTDNVWLIVKYLQWDSEYFKCPTYRVEFSDWDKSVLSPVKTIAELLTKLVKELATRHGRFYLFAEIPSEDIAMLQAMGLAGFKLIETRLTFFHNDVAQFSYPQRAAVRPATTTDIANLREVAMTSRNDYDRYHADPFFSQTVADEYLGTFVENSVKGFADVVLVPAIDHDLPGAFFTANVMPTPMGINVGRIVLVAVGESRRGWSLNLLVETTYWFKKQSVKVACMTTQSTNRAVIRGFEKVGYQYGRATHVFATHG